MRTRPHRFGVHVALAVALTGPTVTAAPPSDAATPDPAIAAELDPGEPIEVPPLREPGPEPRRGLGALIPGVVLLGAVVVIGFTDVVLFSGPSPCSDVCLPISLYTWPLLLPAIPLTAVGAVRMRRHREWKQRLNFTPRATGFTLRF